MGRLPFDPSLVRGATPASRVAAGSAGAQPITVTQLASLIKEALAEAVPAKVRVVGEVSNFSNRTHWFFSLKDENATIRCVCFASSARQVGCPVADGMQVVATGRLDFYDQQGHVQLYVDKIEPVGQGTLELRLRQMMEELRRLGYFAEERKKPLPLVPCKVAIVTSRSGAALQDVIDTARRRWGGCQLYLVDVRVQGAAAAPEIAGAIRWISLNRKRLEIDAVILTRGGGSIEDLWAFNERVVAEAIYRCALPIVAAIGHETDTTVAELVADLRCSTPTQAVMRLLPERAALEHQLEQARRRMHLLVHRRLVHEKQRLHHAARHALFRRPERLLHDAADRVDALQRRLATALPRRLQPAHARLENALARLSKAAPMRLKPAQAKVATLDCELGAAVQRRFREDTLRLDALERQLAAINPHNVLHRGYSYTLAADGSVLKHAGEAKAGERLTTVLADGRVMSRVEGQSDERLPGAAASMPVPSTSRSRKRRGAAPQGPGLFG